MRSSVLLLVLFGAFVPGMVDGGQDGLPIIDMHFHGALAFDEQEVQPIRPWLEAFDRRGVTKAVLTSFPHQLEAWAPQDPDRLIPSLWFPCMTQFVRKCFPGGEPLPDLAWVRRELEAGRIAMLGEVGTQLFGIYPSSPELEPYFSLAEEFDIPFALHMGPGPHWAVTDASIYKEFPDFEIAAGNPLELEDVLRQHPDLRLYIMHAGWPMIDEILTILWHHPNVYVDLGHLQGQVLIFLSNLRMVPRARLSCWFLRRAFGEDLVSKFLDSPDCENIHPYAAPFTRCGQQDCEREFYRGLLGKEVRNDFRPTFEFSEGALE